MNPFQDAFISYGRADSKPFAQGLYDRLVAEGYGAWFDFEDIPLGVDYQKQIDDGIDKADNFLFVISPHAINSRYCGLEIELALQRGKRIIPLLHVEEISREPWQQRQSNGTEEDWAEYCAAGKHSSFPNMHPEIGKINWVYFREEQDDYEQSFHGLLELLNRQKDYVHQHTILLNQALDWERNQKRTRYLLIGEERQQAETWLLTPFKTEQAPCIPTDLHCEYITASIKNANNLMTQVFLCHSEQDREIAEQVRHSLMRNGLTTWTHRSDIEYGDDFHAAMTRGLEEADNVIFLLSPHSLASAYCQQELDYALSLHKRIIPMRAGQVDPTQVPESLKTLQYIDLTDNQTEADYLQDESDLLRILKREADYGREHKVLLTKALKWERQQRNPCILLRGYELQHAEAWLKLAQQHQYGATALQTEFIAESQRQPSGMSLDVFVSYSRADSDFARKLNDGLQRQGQRTWFDQESIALGADFQQEIYKGIEASDHFLFILSPSSVRSQYCASEVEHAAKLNKRIVTVRHQTVEAAELHPELAKVQWVDFLGHDRDFGANFKELIRTLDEDPAHLRFHTQLLMQAIAWDEQGRREGRLLRGEDLSEAEQWLLKAAGKQPRPTGLQGEYVGASRKSAANRQRSLIGVLGSLLVLAVITGLVAFRQSLIASQALTEAKARQQEAEKLALNSEIKAKTLAVENLMAADLNSEAFWNALALGHEIKSLMPSTFLEAATRFQAVSVLREIYNFDGYLQRNILQGHESAVMDLAFSSDGQLIASASWDGTVKLWDINGQVLKTIQGHENEVNSVSFSPDNKTIATAGADGTVKIWDMNGRQIHSLEGHQGWVMNVSFSPDGQTIASASLDGTVKIWNTNGRQLKTFEGHQNGVRSVSFSPDGRTIASASDDGTVRLWNRNGRESRTFQGHSDQVMDVSFSPDGRTIASASDDGTVKLWNRSGRELETLQSHGDKVKSVIFSPDGRTIASASYDGTVIIWDRDGREIQTLGHANWIRAIAFSPKNQVIASASLDGNVRIWDKEGHDLKVFKSHDGAVLDLTFSSNGQLIASASWDGTVKISDQNGKILKTIQGHENEVNSVDFSPDNKTIATAGADGTVKLWDMNGRQIRSLEGHEGWVMSASFSPDGQTIASASLDGTVKLWDTNGRQLKTLQGHDDGASDVQFSPDGLMIVTASKDGRVKLWSREGNQLRILSQHKGPVRSIHFSPNSQVIISVGEDGLGKLWNIKNQETKILQGHRSVVWNVSFSPDGQTIASASNDKTVRLWDIEGQQLQTLEGHEDWVMSVNFSPDGQTIASGSNDGTIIIWNMNFNDLMYKSCVWLRDYMANPVTPKEHKVLCPRESGISSTPLEPLNGVAQVHNLLTPLLNLNPD
jgi:WD40 repeat protein